jgi:hypothetical protein
MLRLTLNNVDVTTIAYLKDALVARIENLNSILKVSMSNDDRVALINDKENVKRLFNHICDKEREFAESTQY